MLRGIYITNVFGDKLEFFTARKEMEKGYGKSFVDKYFPEENGT